MIDGHDQHRVYKCVKLLKKKNIMENKTFKLNCHKLQFSKAKEELQLYTVHILKYLHLNDKHIIY